MLRLYVLERAEFDDFILKFNCFDALAILIACNRECKKSELLGQKKYIEIFYLCTFNVFFLYCDARRWASKDSSCQMMS